MTHQLTAETAARFAEIALGHVTREYPHKLDHVLSGPRDAATPGALHPLFHGSFDWHSCVHGHWLLARVYRLYPLGPAADDTRRLLDRQFTPAKVAAELDYLSRPLAGGFERPYGWAWLLALQAELEDNPAPECRMWAASLRPLADAFAARFRSYLPKLTYPIRAGTHGNSAFAMTLAARYARICRDAELLEMMGARAMRWFGADADAQAWEPSGDDFLSPVLIEAECMRELAPEDAFAAWFWRLLPRLAEGEPATLFEPAVVSDPTDGKIAHLDGLNLSRAWCFRTLAKTVPAGDPRQAVMLDAAGRHLQASLPAVAGDYMGEHWLASFALLALEAA